MQVIKPLIPPFLCPAWSPWTSPQRDQSRTSPPAFCSPLAAPQARPGLSYSSSVRRASGVHIFFAALFSDKQGSRQMMWDVDSLFVRQGAAATCWHPATYKWKGFSFCVSSHGRFQGWKLIGRRWCTSSWARRDFSLMVSGPLTALLTPMGLTIAHFLFSLCLSSCSRAAQFWL